MAEDKNQSNIKAQIKTANVGLDMDNSIPQIGQGKLSYALNAAVENFDANSVNYQNEPGNEFCLQFPTGFVLIGKHFIQEKNKHIFFLTNPTIKASEIGYMENNDCIYHSFINAPCLNFNINHPIHKVIHKITNCSVEIYWTDNFNSRRFLDLDATKIPYVLADDSEFCDPKYTHEVDCNQLKLQPNFSIPSLKIKEVVAGGELTAGTVQFAIQYSDSSGNPYTSYYSITNPTPLADTSITTPNFNYNVGKSVIVTVDNLDETGEFQYFNLAVIKTVNGVSSPELVGTYFIDSKVKDLTYSGQNKTSIKLSINEIFEKQPFYDLAEDLTTVGDVLIWKGLTSIDRINYQQIANKITLEWETWRIPATENYSDELNATNLRGYLRDEVYPFEICFLLKNGKQTDGFHIPGRTKNQNEVFPDVSTLNNDFIGKPEYTVDGVGYSPYWKIYNTGSVKEFSGGYINTQDYKGPYQYGDLAYWESTDVYPCTEEIWGELAGQPIRHHKFPDVSVSPIFEENPFTGTASMEMGSTAVFPIGIRIDEAQVFNIIKTSTLTKEQKADIVGFKILRGDRSTNKSIIGKGILRNVGEYKRQEQSFYFPNYPYNDLNEDPFLTDTNNKFEGILQPWLILCSLSGEFEYTNPDTGLPMKEDMVAGTNYERCSLTKPIFLSGRAMIGPADFEAWNISNCDPNSGSGDTSGNFTEYTSTNGGQAFIGINYSPFIGCNYYNVSGFNVGVGKMINNNTGATALAFKLPSVLCEEGQLPNPDFSIEEQLSGRISPLNCGKPEPLKGFSKENINYRQVFNSPETSFGQPFLGNILKLENTIFGKGRDHFIQVKNNAKYRLLSKEAQVDALTSSQAIGGGDLPVLFAAYQAYLTIYINGITRKNYAYSYNSIADYNYKVDVDNGFGIKQREIELKSYLIPGVQNVGDDKNINNYQRESSVFIKTSEEAPPLPFPNQTPNIIGINGQPIVQDKSRTTISESDRCSVPTEEQGINVLSYYASLKNNITNQWGQIYSYETIDTGYQKNKNTVNKFSTVFGGDTFISRFTFKTKLPFFIDNRVGAPDDADIFYDELGNIAYPKYWHSARSILESWTSLKNFISYKAHNFDCPNDPSKIIAPSGVAGTYRTYYDGYFYLFAYGIPNFYCETSYNLDLRQAFNNKEGDFFPHVSSGIPDDWVQESFVSIANDNTYNYNTTYSKQNKENNFTHLPTDWKEQLCFTNYPFRAIYSNPQSTDSDIRINNWLVYKPLSYFDFPQNYGNLISLDGIQNKAVLARFENKSLLYNNLLLVNTSNPQSAYLGNPDIFKGPPPIDFAETDLGYVGCQNKLLLKIPQGQITVDAKRGQVFLIEGTQAVDLTTFGSGMNRFFTDHLAFEILRYFPEVNTDNNFTGVGLTGVYDSKFERMILTKLDYIPIDPDVKYDETKKEFYIETIEYIDGPTTTTTSSTSTTTSTSTTSTTTSSTTSTTTSSTSTTTTTTTACLDCVEEDVVIGTQTWMKCNFDGTTYKNGDPIPEVQDPVAWAALTTGAWCYYNNDISNAPYGKIYNLHALQDARGLGPTGYRVPTNSDFATLITFLGGSSISGTALKEQGFCHWNSSNTAATNSSTFTAFGGGLREEVTANFILFQDWTYFGSSTSFTPGYGRSLELISSSSSSPIATGLSTLGAYVRLIKE